MTSNQINQTMSDQYGNIDPLLFIIFVQKFKEQEAEVK